MSNNKKIYKLKNKDASARRGEVTTEHGVFQTPAFMPVGTSGAVKALTSEDLEEAGAEIILGNTYHLYLRPGHEIVKSQGGLAKFNGWNKPTLTDSGGYQVFSLKDISKITDDGVEFQSHHDGSRHRFTPEKVTEIQHAIGADIIMAFDQCVPYPATKEEASTGVKRTYDWARRCQLQHKALSQKNKTNVPFTKTCAPNQPNRLPGWISPGMLSGAFRWGRASGRWKKYWRILSGIFPKINRAI